MSHEYVYKISGRYLQKWLRYSIKHVKKHFRPIAQLVERQTLDILPGSSPGSSRFGARYIRASWRGWSAVGAAAAASWSLWVGRTVSGFVGTLNFRF